MLPADGFRAVDSRLQAMAAAGELSGAVLLTRHGGTVLEGCYGPADRAAGLPVTPRTRFGLASVSKMFTAVAVADQVAAGRLAFDRPVVDVLPQQRRPGALRDDVTVHHLLCHTSGIADYAEEDEDTPGYVDDYASLWRHLPCYRMERPADFLPLFADRRAYRPPGQRFQYSNAGFILLALVVEEVTGRPFTEVVEERVLARAGMSDSGYLRSDAVEPDVAVGYLPAVATPAWTSWCTAGRTRASTWSCCAASKVPPAPSGTSSSTPGEGRDPVISCHLRPGAAPRWVTCPARQARRETHTVRLLRTSRSSRCSSAPSASSLSRWSTVSRPSASSRSASPGAGLVHRPVRDREPPPR